MNKNNSRYQQKGFVSIIVAATVMILLSLITIGFTRIMQREQREALDRQLTRQATYAAESGINTVWKYIQEDGVEEEKKECSYTDGDVYRLDNGSYIEIDGTPDYTPSAFYDEDDDSAAIQVTCILYDKNPTTVVNQVGENQETIFPFEEKDDENFDTITISWRGESAVNYDSSCTNGAGYEFPASHSGTPVLKLDLTNTSSFSRNALASRTNYLYLIPCNSGPTSISLSNSRQIYKTNIDCDDEGICSVTLDVSALNSSSFFVRHKLFYDSGEISMGGVNALGDNAEIKRAQSVIDVTARATDVIRRLRVHVPYGEAQSIPGSVITLGTGNSGGSPNNGLCKMTAIIDQGPDLRITDICR